MTVAARGKFTAVTMYGIKTCNTVRKARFWLDERGIAFTFHDFKSEGITRPLLEAWVKAAGRETVLNRAGTTFRNLPDASKQGLSEMSAIALMLDQPSMIKRPVLDAGGRTIIGFKAERYGESFAPMITSKKNAP